MSQLPRSIQDRGGEPQASVPPQTAGETSSRAGYFPVPLQHVPASSFEALAIYLRSGASGEGYTLYSAPDLSFSQNDRNRLLDQGVRVVYVRMVDHIAFQQQMEESLKTIVADPDLAMAERSAILYDTCVELVDELLNEPNLATQSPRLEQVSRAVTHMVLNEDQALSHLHKVSHHDYYTATHMVNVATYMVTLAYAMGHEDTETLSLVCQAGLVHDVGKTEIPSEILNKSGALTDDDWAAIKRHPETGYEQLRQTPDIDPMILCVVREHHEREDGSGYPHGLNSTDIHIMSKICAVVDSFDAMTAFRPFKSRTMSVAEALSILQDEAGTKYDENAVRVWIQLLGGALPEENLTDLLASLDSGDSLNLAQTDEDDQRDHPRFQFLSNATLHIPQSENGPNAPPDRLLQVKIKNLSRSGLGLVSRDALQAGTYVLVRPERRTEQVKVFAGRVVRCQSLSNGLFEMGVAFDISDG